MTDKTKEITKWAGVGAIALGALGVYFGGGTEGFATEIVASVFIIIGIVANLLKK